MQSIRRDAGAESDTHAVTSGLATLGELARDPSLEAAIDAARELLGMEVAYATEFVDGRQVFRALRGDGASFGVHEGVELPLEQTYCQRVLAGRLPNLIADVRGEQRAASLAVTAAGDVGAFVSVPLRFSDGRFYGTLCAASHDAKPSLGFRDLQFLHVLARLIADQLEREQREHAARDAELQAAVVATLLAAVHARDTYTADHSQAVVAHAEAVARRLGLNDPDVIDVKHVALLHDIGKIAIPDAILHKPGPLSEPERQVMRRHPVHSEQIIGDVPALSHLAPAIRAEHERFDGSGYPDGLAGEQIPLASRITFVCDAYHAMTSDRPYRRAMAPETARAELAAGAGSQFCPRATHALLDTLTPPHRGTPQTPSTAASRTKRAERHHDTTGPSRQQSLAN